MGKLSTPLAFFALVVYGIQTQACLTGCTSCPSMECYGEGAIKTFYMTPSWLNSHASYINSERSTSASQITFNAGLTSNAALLKVQLIPAGALMDGTPLTVEITVANDISIGKRVDSDIRYGVSDGSKFIGFESRNKGNYPTDSPCYGVEGVSGASLSSIRRDAVTPKPTDSDYPGQFVYTLKLDEHWGSCYTVHDGGFVKTASYNNRLVLSKGLTLEVYKSDKWERVGIRFIRVVINKDS
ncbi:uncharacterized protein [Acropora muricata]|uniref:uncharacterized protein isoform X2 n=1 Tax=Acropora muricata TaxID=159855 RepID=UPI0034E4BCF9